MYKPKLEKCLMCSSLWQPKSEDKTFELIARFQPVASDLRAIKSYMKIGNDFARYGRYALDISSINDQLNALTLCEPWTSNISLK